MNYFKLATRNLLRNKRRTIITISSILFALFFATLMRSFQLGTYSLIINNAIESYSGHLQVQQTDYADDPSLNNTFVQDSAFISICRKIANIKAVAPRLETFSLASSGNLTKGALVLGIDPKAENQFSNPQKKLVKYHLTDSIIKLIAGKQNIPENTVKALSQVIGKYYVSKDKLKESIHNLEIEIDTNLINLIAEKSRIVTRFFNSSDSAVVISSGLAKFLNISVGDSIILMGQGYHGMPAAGIFPVCGIIRISNPDLNNKVAYMPLQLAQEFTGCIDRISYWTINLYSSDDENIIRTQDKLEETISDQTLSVKTWKELNRALVQQIESDNQSGIIILVILYFVIFFGIFGTVIMMVHERTHEFGVLVSLGMQKHKLSILITVEMLLIGLIAITLGLLLSLPIIYYYHINPITLTGDTAKSMLEMGFEPLLPMAPFGSYVYTQVVTVMAMIIAATIYPARRILKLKEIEALRKH